MAPRSFAWLKWLALISLVPIAIACRSVTADYPTPPVGVAAQAAAPTPRSTTSAGPRTTPLPKPIRPTPAFSVTPDTSGFGNPYVAYEDFQTAMAARKEVVYQVGEDLKRSWPGMAMLESRVDEVAARLTTLDDARQRTGNQLGTQPGTTRVWWVRVRGFFRYQGTGSAVVEARERIFVYDGKTGSFIAQSILPAAPAPASSSCPEALGPAQPSVPAFPPERWSPKGLLPVGYALARGSDGKAYTIYAGGLAEDPYQGAVVISEGAPDPCADAASTSPRGTASPLMAPVRAGAVRIVQIDGDLILLETTERHRFWLSMVTKQFGEIVAPGVTPPTPDPSAIGRPPAPPTPRGDTLEPRSTPVAEGQAYPFELWTHCGIDRNVDFAGSFWDLDDPEWPKEGGTAYYKPDGTYVQWIGNPSQKGTMTLIDADRAVFRFDRGQIQFKRHDGPKFVPWCA